MQPARLEADLAPFKELGRENVYRCGGSHGERPGEVRAVDDALAGEVALAEERASGAGQRAEVDGELKRRREEVLPFLELVSEFGDDGGELVVIKGDAGVARVEKVVDAVEEPAHGDAGEEVEGGLFLVVLR